MEGGGGKKLLILTDEKSNEGPITPINTCNVWGAACQHTLHAAFCILTAHTLDTSTDASKMVEVESNTHKQISSCVDIRYFASHETNKVFQWHSALTFNMKLADG